MHQKDEIDRGTQLEAAARPLSKLHCAALSVAPVSKLTPSPSSTVAHATTVRHHPSKELRHAAAVVTQQLQRLTASAAPAANQRQRPPAGGPRCGVGGAASITAAWPVPAALPRPAAPLGGCAGWLSLLSPLVLSLSMVMRLPRSTDTQSYARIALVDKGASAWQYVQDCPHRCCATCVLCDALVVATTALLQNEFAEWPSHGVPHRAPVLLRSRPHAVLCPHGPQPPASLPSLRQRPAATRRR